MTILLPRARQHSQWARHIVLTVLLMAFFAPSLVSAQNQCQPEQITDNEALVQFALSCNAYQQALGSRWQAQQLESKVAGKLDDPRLRLGVAPATLGEENFDDGYIVELSQALPWPGVLALREEVAEAQSDVWQARQSENQVQLANSVRQMIAQWQYHQQMLLINQRHQQLWQEFLHVIEIKYSAGKANKSAVLQASNEHNFLQQEAIELQASMVRDMSQLKRHANLPSRTQLTLEPLSPITTLPVGGLDNMMALLDEQPMLQNLGAQHRKKTKELRLAVKDRYPNFTVKAGYSGIWLNDEQRWQVGVSLNIPFGYGKRSNHEGSLRAEQDALRLEQQDTHIKLTEQLVQTHSFWWQSKEVYDLYQTNIVPLAQESLTTARDEYESGSGSFLSLLTAHRQLLETERKSARVIRDQYSQYAQLIAAAGLIDMNPWLALQFNHNPESALLETKPLVSLENQHE